MTSVEFAPTYNKKKTESVVREIKRNKDLQKAIRDNDITCLTSLIRRGIVADMMTSDGVSFDDPAVYRAALQPIIQSIHKCE